MIVQLHTYSADINLEEFHKKWVPKECLPSDLGGDLPSIVEMHKAFRKEMMDMTDYFVAEEHQRNRAVEIGKDQATVTSVSSKFSNLDFD